MTISSDFTWSSGVFSDTGNKRKLNEDSYLHRPDQGFWAVADGMGGHHSGDVASQTVVAYLSTLKNEGPLRDRVTAVEDALIQANNDLQKRASDEQRNALMGSTIAGMLYHNGYNILFWAGDSRIYRIRGNRLTCISEDHSMVQAMVLAGEIEASEAESHPSANMILRAVGGEPNIFVDFDYAKINDGDRYLICSDGLFKDLSENALSSLLLDKDLHKTLDSVLHAALEAGGNDNITAILVDFTEQKHVTE